MKKKIWDLTPNDIVLLNGKRYRHSRDFVKRRPVFGPMHHRELVNVDDASDTSWWLRNLEVEVEQP